MKKCLCKKCECTNEIKEFGHRYEEENAIVQAEFEHDVDKVASMIQEICSLCEKGQHQGKSRSQIFRKI
ncbi:MAG: hypothetical protein OEL77_04215 [Nitrosopumilus sp.]|nr:hypothetical protein [Nitrosopumilus sp.]MDH3385202.1 hypothetical protein [Nitrosopumilus sp.]